MPEAETFPAAADPKRVVGGQTGANQGEGSAGNAHTPEERMDGDPLLGMQLKAQSL